MGSDWSELLVLLAADEALELELLDEGEVELLILIGTVAVNFPARDSCLAALRDFRAELGCLQLLVLLTERSNGLH